MHHLTHKSVLGKSSGALQILVQLNDRETESIGHVFPPREREFICFFWVVWFLIERCYHS